MPLSHVYKSNSSLFKYILCCVISEVSVASRSFAHWLCLYVCRKQNRIQWMNYLFKRDLGGGVVGCGDLCQQRRLHRTHRRKCVKLETRIYFILFFNTSMTHFICLMGLLGDIYISLSKCEEHAPNEYFLSHCFSCYVYAPSRRGNQRCSKASETAPPIPRIIHFLEIWRV